MSVYKNANERDKTKGGGRATKNIRDEVLRYYCADTIPAVVCRYKDRVVVVVVLVAHHQQKAAGDTQSGSDTRNPLGGSKLKNDTKKAASDAYIAAGETHNTWATR